MIETGTLRLILVDELLELASGDSVYLAADVPPGYANHGESGCA